MLKPKSNQSSVCTNKPKKFKQTFPARKLITAVFGDRRRMLMVEFMQQGTTIMSAVRFKTLKKLHSSIQKKKAWNADIWCSAPA
jgi:hypothetical protein